MNELFFLKHKIFYYKDPIDNENVEDIYIIGYFTMEKINDAVKYCIEKGIPRNELVIEKYKLNLRPNRKYIYVLSYEYSTKLKNGEYQDYYYIFEPMLSRKACVDLKLKLLKEKNYSNRKEKIYDISKDGFYISKEEINAIYHINYH